jgi:PKD repeat protein
MSAGARPRGEELGEGEGVRTAVLSAPRMAAQAASAIALPHAGSRRRSRAGLLAAALGVATLALSLGASPAGAVVANIGGHTYGVTPIKGVSPLSVPGAKLAPGAAGLAPRNFDGAPKGGGPLLYHNGPVMHSVNTHVIYWDPKKEFTLATKGVFAKFFADVAHDKELASNVFPIAGQYKDAAGNAAYVSSVGSEGTDAKAYPASGCVVPNEVDLGPPYTKCLTDSQLQTELSAYISLEKLPTGPAQQYFLLLPHKVVSCLETGVCSNNFFCAYHSSINPGTSGEIIYSDIPFSLLDSTWVKGCQDDGNAGVQHPNGDVEGTDESTRFADVALKYTSHEYTEAATDPTGGGYFDAQGLENGDKCNGVSGDGSGIGYDSNAFLPVLGGVAGSGTLFDQSINAHGYYLQSEWDNAAKACLMRPVALSGAFTASAGVVGSPVGFSGTVVDPYGEPEIAWSFGDGAKGTGSSPSHTYAAPGKYTVTMTARDGLTGSTATPVEHAVTVNDLPTASFTASPNPAPAGTPVEFDGTASKDPDGSIVAYAWSFGDGSATATGAKPSHLYGAGGTYTVTLTVTDSAGVTATATHSVSVQGAPPLDEVPTASLTASPNPAPAGAPVAFDGSASSDPDGSIVGYAWSFGDGSAIGTGATPSHTYPAPGIYTVTLTVTDSSAQTATSTLSLSVQAAAPVVTPPPQGPSTQLLETLPALGVLPSSEHKPAPTPDAALASTSLAVSSSGLVSVKISCPAGVSSCIGTVTLRTLSAVSARSKAAVLTLAVASFTVAGGHESAVKLHLSVKARKLLARTRLVRARATIAAHDPLGATHTARTTVTLRPAARHK